MESTTLIAIVSIITAGITMGLGSIAPALGEGRAVSTALSCLRSSPMPPLPSHEPCSWALHDRIDRY